MCILGPTGEYLAGPKWSEEGIVHIDVDLGERIEGKAHGLEEIAAGMEVEHVEDAKKAAVEKMEEFSQSQDGDNPSLPIEEVIPEGGELPENRHHHTMRTVLYHRPRRTTAVRE